eukprot:Mycagemm_TRINITY_DN10306_c1_g3::TRINITY_DN10306_c1_g3_i1::g.1181::m.1181 type:complete len:107 gc:universal TRINITY_DN10306_c1_g3_i1:508-828(+)
MCRSLSISPVVASNWPTMRFMRVDLPTPLRPTSAMRESQSMPKLRCWKIVRSPYLKLTSLNLSGRGPRPPDSGKENFMVGSSVSSSTASILSRSLARDLPCLFWFF